MSNADYVYLMKQTLYLVFWLSLPTILVASVVGTLFSLFQALTQIQEQTLSFAIKLAAVFGVLLLTASWMGGETYNFSISIFDMLPRVR